MGGARGAVAPGGEMELPKKPGAVFRKQKRHRERSDLDKQVAIKNWLLLSKSYLLLQPATNLVQNDPNSIQYDDSNSVQNDKLNLNNKANPPAAELKCLASNESQSSKKKRKIFSFIKRHHT